MSVKARIDASTIILLIALALAVYLDLFAADSLSTQATTAILIVLAVVTVIGATPVFKALYEIALWCKRR